MDNRTKYNNVTEKINKNVFSQSARHDIGMGMGVHAYGRYTRTWAWAWACMHLMGTHGHVHSCMGLGSYPGYKFVWMGWESRGLT